MSCRIARAFLRSLSLLPACVPFVRALLAHGSRAKRDSCALLCLRTWGFLPPMGRDGAGAAGWATSRPGGPALCAPLTVFCPHFGPSQRCAFGVVTGVLSLCFSHCDLNYYVHMVILGSICMYSLRCACLTPLLPLRTCLARSRCVDLYFCVILCVVSGCPV